MRIFLSGVCLADQIHNEEIYRMAGTSEDVTVRIKQNVLSWFGHVERMSDERMAKKIYDGTESGKRGSGRPRLTFENTVSNILEEGYAAEFLNTRSPLPTLLCAAYSVKLISFFFKYIYLRTAN